jgi:hypothetical protein
MRLPSATVCLFGCALVTASAGTLGAQSTPRASGRNADVPAALSAVREADLRRDVTEMASPRMRGREGACRP